MSTFELVRGVEGDCLVLDDTRICGPKPWGGGRVIKTFHTDGIYEVINKDEHHELLAENAKLRELVQVILSDMDAWQMVIASGDTGYGKGCLERLYDLRDQAHELGVEVGE